MDFVIFQKDKVYILTEGMFTVVFKRQAKNYATNNIVNGIVNANEQSIVDLLKTKPGLNASEIAQSISKSWRTTMRYLKSPNESQSHAKRYKAVKTLFKGYPS